ncbi:MAG: cupin domain-containing protein [Caldilineaceae bacterium]
MLGIGQKLRDARLAQNLSLRDLAAKTEVTASLLSQIENEKANPSVRTLHSLADALGLPVDYFFPDRDEGDAENTRAVAASELTASELRQQQINGVNSSPPIFTPPPEKALSPILRAHERPTIHLQGDVTWARLTPGKEAGKELMEICYAPGATSGERLSHHSGREFVMVLAGELTLELGFDQYKMAPGDSAIFDSETPHRLSNYGEEPMRAVSIIFAQ